MDDYLKSALEIVKAQASVRNMTDEEITTMMRRLTIGIREVTLGLLAEDGETAAAADPKKAVREKSITCVECAKSFKVITKKHLATHGLTPETYKAKHGYKKSMPLVCKSLQRERRKKMQAMRLWEKKGKVVA
ncbi:Ros/MucR family transcriptional regulator [Solidesulfovibrio sp.]